MVVTTPDNYRRTRARRFSVQGVKSRYRRAVERLGPGDRICWYLVGIAGFVATATVTSPAFEDHRPIWVSRTTGHADPYPWRFRIARDIDYPIEDKVADQPAAAAGSTPPAPEDKVETGQ